MQNDRLSRAHQLTWWKDSYPTPHRITRTANEKSHGPRQRAIACGAMLHKSMYVCISHEVGLGVTHIAITNLSHPSHPRRCMTAHLQPPHYHWERAHRVPSQLSVALVRLGP